MIFPNNNYEEALAEALAWARSEKSHWNSMLTAESSPEQRTQTFAHTAIADAAEVEKWCAIARAYAAGELVHIARTQQVADQHQHIIELIHKLDKDQLAEVLRGIEALDS